MQKTFDFGEIKCFGGNRKYRVTVTIELDESRNNKPVFTACGNIGKRVCGQCLNDIAKYVDDARFTEIYRLWNLYHLNDMRTGTREQENALKECKSQDYAERCNFLKERGLYEVMHDGEPYRYGHAWLYEPIPADDMAAIMALFK